MKIKSVQYPSYTIMEVLVVLAVVIVLGTLGAFAFGGFRDSTIARENIENIKQNVQLAQQKSMLLERGTNENWIYGIGIDFTQIDQGVYRFFKWCSPFDTYGHPMTRSERPAFDPTQDVGEPLNIEGTVLNAYLPLNLDSSEGSRDMCNLGVLSYPSSALVRLSGMEDIRLSVGFNIGLGTFDPPPSYLVFEAVTGRAFLYNADGSPSNNPISITIYRNRGKLVDVVLITPDGRVLQAVVGPEDIVQPETPPSDDSPSPPQDPGYEFEIILPGGGDYSCYCEPTRDNQCIDVVCDSVM
jgi:type II secretory pathway pseudopilin PulG